MNEKNMEFEKFYKKTYKQVFRYVYFRMKSREIAEDLAHEAFLRAFEHFDKFDRERGCFLTWIIAILKREIWNFLKKREKYKFCGDFLEPEELDAFFYKNDLLGVSDLSRLIERKEAVKAVKAEINGLTGRQKEVINLKYYKELKLQEIAAELGCSKQNVCGVLQFAKKTMRKKLKEFYKN
jgi:RNA polymerase sigma-70 factor (ECF subfamily)